MAWGADREQALKGILRALLEFRVEGVATNIPLLREILLQKEFACGSYHTGSLPQWHQDHAKQSKNHGGKVKMSDKEHDKGDREKAAALGVAIALALAANGTPDSPTGAPAPSPWRAAGRRDQFNSRSPTRAGWR
jgi:acetyl/propionyl-CoA carboxylase alpha subunit